MITNTLSNLAQEHDQLTDNALVKLVLRGEKSLYEILMRRNNQLLYRIIRTYLNHHEEVEDVMQDTYLKAFEKLHQFKHHAQFSTWLIRIGINEALAKVRLKEKQLAIYETPYSLSISQETSTSVFVENYNPEKEMINREATQILEKAIESLGDKYRLVYVLREIEGMRIAQIAEYLHLSEANVKVRLHRSKKQIKEVLYQQCVKGKVFEFGSTKCDLLVRRVLATI